MASEIITSFKNPLLKSVAALRERAGRKATGLTIVEGCREAGMALSSGVAFEKLIFVPELVKASESRALLLAARKKNVSLVEMPAEVFSKIAFGDRLEGILGIVRPPTMVFKDLKLKKDSLIVVTEHLEKPGNLGAILRTADAAGIDCVIACDEATDIYNPNVIRASLGAVFSISIIEATSGQALSFLREKKVAIYGTFPDAKDDYAKCVYKKSCAFVLGGEQEGLSDFWAKNADVKIKLPMNGQVNSLNVAATAAIVIYEALRQRTL